jgi:RHS repeat-associated protein
VYQKFKRYVAAAALALLGLMPGLATATDETIHFHNDPSGTPMAATDSNGNLIWKASYQPYGKELDQAAAGANNALWFHGKPYDPATGLSYFQARNYDPLTGRFTGIDPQGFGEGNIHSFNRYAYGNNNPYKYVDPDGRSPVEHFLHELSIIQSHANHSLIHRIAAPAPHLVNIDGSGVAAMGGGAGLGGAKGVGKLPGPATDKAGNEIGRVIVDSRGNAMIEPVGGRTVAAGKGGVDTHTLYPNGSNYQRLNPQGHANNSTPHGHGHELGTGPGMKGQGPSLDVNGNAVPWNSPAAHWPIN